MGRQGTPTSAVRMEMQVALVPIGVEHHTHVTRLDASGHRGTLGRLDLHRGRRMLR